MVTVAPIVRPVTDEAEWDAQVVRLGGHFLQSWRWGAFKERSGWEVDRIAVGGDEPIAMAQVLFRKRGPISVGYVPRGPVFREGDADGFHLLMGAIDATCRKRRALYVILESDQPWPPGVGESGDFTLGPAHIQPGRTVKVPLLEDEALLKQMHQKTRYSVRLAERREVELQRVEHGDQQAVADFHALLSETADRNQFGVHTLEYYRDFLEVFGDDAIFLFAVIEGIRAAAVISVAFGSEAIYMYGASSTQHRAHGAAHYLQYGAMRWARERGMAWYDLWGIPDQDPEPVSEEDARGAPATQGDDWRGLFRFKTGFGGKIVAYPPMLERAYHPVVAKLARRVAGARA